MRAAQDISQHVAPNRRNHISSSALEQRAPYGQPAGGDRGKTKSGESVRTCFTADLCSGNTLGSTSFLIASVPLPSVYPPHFYCRKRGHSFNNIPLHRPLSLPGGGCSVPQAWWAGHSWTGLSYFLHHRHKSVPVSADNKHARPLQLSVYFCPPGTGCARAFQLKFEVRCQHNQSLIQNC